MSGGVEDTSIGGVTWHSSEEDGGPDVGISVFLGPDDRLWAGEISRRTFEEWGADVNFDGDDGKFLVRYVGKDVKIIAKFGDYDEHLQEFMEQIAAWVRASASGQALRKSTIEKCADIALAIDSGRGNEKEIAKVIRALPAEVQP